MNAEQAIEFVDDLVFARTGKYLNDIQRILLRESWSETRHGYEDIAKSYGYSVNYLKQDAGPKLWQILSEACGEKIKKTNCRSALERQAKVLSTSPLLPTTPQAAVKTRDEPGLTPVPSQAGHQDWGQAPDVSNFYDRFDELAQLQQWILGDRCRLVTLTGMGGIGKTHLSVKLAQQIQGNFEYVIWRSLIHAPSLQQILTSLLEILNDGQEKDLPASADEKILLLINYFKKYRCLLVLDNVEVLLTGGTLARHYRPEYQDYSRFFKRVGECKHGSCLVITSREKPEEISLMEGEALPVRSLTIKGLNISAVISLVNLKRCYYSTPEDCLALAKKHGGNPLAIKIVCGATKELFEGNISEYIKQNNLVFQEIYTLLDEQFNRLSSPEQYLLYCLAINQEDISEFNLQSGLSDCLKEQNSINIIKSLLRRSWRDKGRGIIPLQPALKDYLLSRLIDDLTQEIQFGELTVLKRNYLLKARAKDYIREAQIALVIQPLIGRLTAVYQSQKQLEYRLKQILLKLQEQPSINSGYAAGNIINILCQMQVDLTGYDLSYLTIWEAYLQNVNLHEVNLAGAELSNSVFAKHLASILSVTFSPDGQLVATGDVNGEIRLWQVAESQLLQIFKGHAGWIHSVAFSPDGCQLASASSDHTVKLWNVRDGSCLNTLTGHNQRVRRATFSPDGRTLASGGSDGTIRLWDVCSGQCLKIFSGHEGYIWSVAFHPHGTMLASASEDRTVKLWDVRTGECLKTLTGHGRWVRTVAFSPDGKLLASGSGDRTIKFWDVDSGSELKTLEGHTQRLRSIAFSPDGQLLASGGGDHTARVWDVSSGRCLKTLHGHSSRLTSVAFSPDGEILASGGEDRAVRLWEVKTGQCLNTWQGYGSWVQSVAFSPDGKILASGSEDRKIRLWNVGGPQPQNPTILSGHEGWVCSVAFSPDGNLLASGSSDYSVKLWEVPTGKCLNTLLGHTRWIRAIAFSPDGLTLASCSGDYTIRLWEVTTGQCLKILAGHRGWLWCVKFSPDGRLVASASEDKTVRIWDPHTGKCLKTLAGHASWVQSLAFSPDGQTLLSGGCDGTLRLWDVGSGECLQVLRGHYSWVQSVAFSPNGQTAASGSCDQTVKLWQLSTGQCWQTLLGHQSWVWSVTFSPDGQVLATGSQDETVKLWDAATGECLETLRSQRPYEGTCITGVRGLTEAQRDTLKALGAKDAN